MSTTTAAGTACVILSMSSVSGIRGVMAGEPQDFVGRLVDLDQGHRQHVARLEPAGREGAQRIVEIEGRLGQQLHGRENAHHAADREQQHQDSREHDRAALSRVHRRFEPADGRAAGRRCDARRRVCTGCWSSAHPSASSPRAAGPAPAPFCMIRTPADTAAQTAVRCDAASHRHGAPPLAGRSITGLDCGKTTTTTTGHRLRGNEGRAAMSRDVSAVTARCGAISSICSAARPSTAKATSCFATVRRRCGSVSGRFIRPARSSGSTR